MPVTGNSFSSTSMDLSKDRTVSGVGPKPVLDKMLTNSINQPGPAKGVSDFNSKSRS